MRSASLTLGRTFGVAFHHGDDFYPALAEFCRDQGVRQGYIPSFIAGFSEIDIVGPATSSTTRPHQFGAGSSS